MPFISISPMLTQIVIYSIFRQIPGVLWTSFIVPGVCQAAIGMYSKDISLSQIHVATSYYDKLGKRYHPRHKMRPFSTRDSRTYDSWYMTTSTSIPTIWAMIDLGSLYHVTGIMLMGSYTENKYVKTFRLSYSRDDITYIDHVDVLGDVKVNIKF